MIFLSHKATLIKNILSKDEYGREIKLVLKEVPFRCIVNIKKENSKESIIGLTEIDTYEMIIKKKLVEKEEITPGIDEILIFDKKFSIMNIEPIILPYTNKIEYVKLTLKWIKQE